MNLQSRSGIVDADFRFLRFAIGNQMSGDFTTERWWEGGWWSSSPQAEVLCSLGELFLSLLGELTCLLL